MYNDINEQTFLFKFLNDPHDIYIKLENENETCDNVFINYLNKMSVYCNPSYYRKLIIFVTLFREYLNKNQNKKLNCFLKFQQHHSMLQFHH